MAPKSDQPLARTLYGKRKMTRSAYSKQVSEKKRTVSGGVRYGKRKGTAEAERPQQGAGTGTTSGPGNPFLIDDGDGGQRRVPRKVVEAIIGKRPELLDLGIAAEYQDGDPRSSVVAFFLRTERKRADGPRPRVIGLLEGTSDGGSDGGEGREDIRLGEDTEDDRDRRNRSDRESDEDREERSDRNLTTGAL